MANVLIIDDDKGVCFTLSGVVRHAGHQPTCAHNLEDGLKAARSGSFDVVFLDVMLPDGNGLDLLPRIREVHSRPEVIIITSKGDPDGAELAIRNGAWDYIQKPSSIKEMTLPLLRALQYREEKMAARPPVALKREGIVGSSPQMRACLELLAQAAHSNTNVLITGETGTGKELFASAIHHNSPRAGGNFVVVDCTALPDALVESMLFGHEKGAFTGAAKSREGLIKQADKGTLFLDEVGELPLHVQKAFLRGLQERRFRPLGGNQEITSDFRLVAATNRDLDEMAKEGRFRKDLLFRLRAFTIEMPLLRERQGDIRPLAMHHLTRLSDRYGTGTKGFSPEFLEALLLYDWPGNVRELFNALESALTTACMEPTLFPKHLPTHIRVLLTRDAIKKNMPATEGPERRGVLSETLPTLKEFREALWVEGEKKYLHDLLLHSNGDVRESCRISGLGRARLYGLMKKYDISRPR